MKVLILNGSPKENGNTAVAIHEMEKIFQENGMEKGSRYHKSIYRMIQGHYPLMAKDEMKNDIQRMYGTMSRLKG